MADTFSWKFLQHFQFLVIQWASRSYHDRFAGMNTQRVKVFHACYRKTVVIRITDHLKLNFFPSFQRLFHQNLFRESKWALSQFEEFLFIGTNTTSESSQRVSRTNHHRITNATCSSNSIFHAFYSLADRSFHINLVELLHKQVTVFRIHDSLNRSTQYFHTIFIQNTLCIKLCTAVQGSLSAECKKNAVGTFFLNNLLYKISSHGKEIHLISNSLGSLNGCDVRVDQYRIDAFFFQGLQCLWTGIIKLSGLSDFECAWTQNKDFFHFLFHFFYCHYKLLFLHIRTKKMRYPQ